MIKLWSEIYSNLEIFIIGLNEEKYSYLLYLLIKKCTIYIKEGEKMDHQTIGVEK